MLLLTIKFKIFKILYILYPETLYDILNLFKKLFYHNKTYLYKNKLNMILAYFYFYLFGN
jgi:hypothetical protein